MADSWIRPFDASYDFVRVSRETGLEVDFVRDIENGGSIVFSGMRVNLDI